MNAQCNALYGTASYRQAGLTTPKSSEGNSRHSAFLCRNAAPYTMCRDRISMTISMFTLPPTQKLFHNHTFLRDGGTISPSAKVTYLPYRITAQSRTDQPFRQARSTRVSRIITGGKTHAGVASVTAPTQGACYLTLHCSMPLFYPQSSLWGRYHKIEETYRMLVDVAHLPGSALAGELVFKNNIMHIAKRGRQYKKK